MTELVHQSLGPLRLLHDALLIVLPDGAGELVIVHSWSVLPLSPEARHTNTVFDLEHSLRAIQPPYAGAVELGLVQELLQELPQVDVGAAASVVVGGALFVCVVCKEGRENR